MTIARNQIVVEDEMQTFHCTSRCVRRAFLCGFDFLTGKDFEHRRAWIQQRLAFLSGIFTLDVLGYSIQSNHLHVILRTRPDRIWAMEEEEVARRWLQLHPPSNIVKDPDQAIPDALIMALMRNSSRLKIYRRRLNSLSWFMGSLDERIARMANREDKCKGRFWEGRFQCKLLTDEAAVLTCMTYVDLNPIRAGETQTPEESRFTSGYERIRICQNEMKTNAEKLGVITTSSCSSSIQRTGSNPECEREWRKVDWLCPLNDTQERLGIFQTITNEEYLYVLDLLGREIMPGKKGSIPLTLEPILQRLHIQSDCWLEAIENYDTLFHRILGRADRVITRARDAGLNWFHGIRSCRKIFSN